MADRTTADVGLGHLVHLDGAHHTRVLADLLQCIA